MANKIPEGLIKRFKGDLATELQDKVFRVSVDLSQDIRTVQKLEEDGEIANLTQEVGDIEAFLKNASPKSSAEAKQKYKEARLRKEGIAFTISRLRIKKSDIYKRIDQNGRTIKALWDGVAFVESFDLENIPQLKYIEVDETRYEAENNCIKRAEDGTKVLYLENNGKATEKSA